MTEHEQLVELVARAIALANDDLDGGEIVWMPYVEDARAAISTIAEALREPTEKMVKAMLDQVETGNPHDTPTEIDVRHGCTAMLSASPLNGEQK